MLNHAILDRADVFYLGFTIKLLKIHVYFHMKPNLYFYTNLLPTPRRDSLVWLWVRGRPHEIRDPIFLKPVLKFELDFNC